MKKSLLVIMISAFLYTSLHSMKRSYQDLSLDKASTDETKNNLYVYTTINRNLLNAIHGGSLKIVQKLCSHIACDPGYTYAHEYFNIDSLHDLAKHRGSLYNPFAFPTYTTTTFHHATTLGNIDIIKKLLKTGKVSINQQDSRGQTPLLLAPNATIAQLLLDNNANPNIADHEGNTPLSYAAIAIENYALTAALLAAGADRKALIPAKTRTIEDRVEAIGNCSIVRAFNPNVLLPDEPKRPVARKLFQ